MVTDKEQPAYEHLRSIVGERTSSLVLWLGAGLSIPAQMPSWVELKEGLCTALDNKALEAEDYLRVYNNKLAAEIRAERSYWVSFERLKDALGEATYTAEIRKALQHSETCEIPQGYLDAFSLPISGVLTLNLDKLAIRAFSQLRPGKPVNEFSGFDSGRHVHLLKSSTPFVLNCHGIHTDKSSWVLTKREITALLKNEGYLAFINACFSSRTVVFMGISADDHSVGGLIESIVNSGIDLGSHFWITDRRDALTEKWAESAGIHLIRYPNKNGDHLEFGAMIRELNAFKPHDDLAAPVRMESSPSTSSLPEPRDLISSDPETIREALNSHAIKLLEPDAVTGKIDYAAYEDFCKTYDEAIYRAWYVTTDSGRNQIFGYSLHEEIADGAFGRVFRASDKEGRLVAVKVLREEIRRKPEMLQSFRRGVRSMRILAKREVEGMIPYEEASEIPTIAVMQLGCVDI